MVAVAGAAVVGGAATAIVQAAIPSTADGQVHACYRNSTGLLDPKGSVRVIDDQAGQNCMSQETALNWNSKKFAYITFKSDSEGNVSVSSTSNITSYMAVANGNYCLKVGFNPKTAFSNTAIPSVEVRGISTEEDADISSFCSSEYNAVVASGLFGKATFMD